VLPLPVEYLIPVIVLSFFLVITLIGGLMLLNCHFAYGERAERACELEGWLAVPIVYSPPFIAGFGLAIYLLVRRGRKLRKLHNF